MEKSLGGSAYGNPDDDEDEECVTLPDDNNDEDSAISLSSNESDLWNNPVESTEVIDNINDIDKPGASKEDEIALLMARIEALKNSAPKQPPDTVTNPFPKKMVCCQVEKQQTAQPTSKPTDDMEIEPVATSKSHSQTAQTEELPQDGHDN